LLQEVSTFLYLDSIQENEALASLLEMERSMKQAAATEGATASTPSTTSMVDDLFDLHGLDEVSSRNQMDYKNTWIWILK
jgi:hypothetical protein